MFVYKIETNDYLTVSTVSNRGSWETYELNHPEEFNTFIHDEWEPLVGRGYLIQQEDTYKMTKLINKQIQKHSVKNKEPVHIVSTESAAGTIRFSLDRPKKVLAFSDFFSYGPLWKLNREKGQAYRKEWLFDNINIEFQDDYENEMRFTNTLLEIEDIEEKSPIYVWVGDNAYEQTGVRLILQLLSGKENSVNLINSTELYVKFIDEKQPIYHTSQMTPDQIKHIFEQGKDSNPLSQADRDQYVREWEALAQTREVLRLWRNHELISVSENYYDSLIIHTIEKLHREQENKDFIKAAKVIGVMLEQMMEEWIGDSFLEYRIRYLIYNGILELKGVPKSMRHYSVKLR
ncbi:DUF1835 domain-containing protein [Cytobacillus massiliigabonensis]|uniref:DUF1835 domain-containing protein n=1 Tax=Cytobacillus massiliigabonensis TaxID=1871011 RepID=UPI0015E101DC|nr:DUF1835 domain-containing protein [Cytobacillus massiliigabonensis]